MNYRSFPGQGMFRACRDSFTPDRKNCIHGVKIYTRTLRILASTHLLHSLIKITGHVFSTKTTCHVIPTCHAIPSWWLIMHKNLSRVKTLFLASAHHPTQKQTKSPSIGIKFVVCNEQTIRSTVAFKQAFMFNKMKNACCCCLKNHWI